jgi:molybdopterin adenylyltransferase
MTILQLSENKNHKMGAVVATNLSAQKGTAKRNISRVEINHLGVVGDAHAGVGHRQVSLLSAASIDAFAQRTGKAVVYGDFGENITFDAADLQRVGLLDRLQINDVLLEVTQIGKECHGSACAIFREVGQCIMPREGFFARVVQPGVVIAGDAIYYTPYTFKVLTITLSDRVVAGVYPDKAGEVAKQMLSQFFADSHWHWQSEQVVLPDDAAKLEACLRQAIAEKKVDLIITLGGTGVGPRDITPEVVSKVCDKFLPRIMEHICLKYGAQHPAALLSRSVAGVAAGITQIYALPGSARAAQEYLTEILKVIEHIAFMLHGVDRHG